MNETTKTIYLSLLLGFAPQMARAEESTWSPLVNGLQARLTLVQRPNEHGRRKLVPYLELRNVRQLAYALEVPVDSKHLKLELVYADGKRLPDRPFSHTTSGPKCGLGPVILPFDSSMRMGLGCLEWDGSELADDQKGKVFLRVTMKAETAEPPWRSWYGALQTPLLAVDWK